MLRSFFAGLLLAPVLADSACAKMAFRIQEISNRLTVGYAVHLVDVSEDGKPDIVVVDSDRVVWFENPTWDVHTIIDGLTKRDNVSLAPADVDGDGRIDFALAADWRPSDTRTSGTLQWLTRGPEGNDWKLYNIGTEPTIHRIRFAALDGDSRPELLVVPLFGRGTTAPNFSEAPLRILSYKIPDDPAKDAWTSTVINQELHVAHNFLPTDMNGDGILDLLVASFEGVSLLKQDLNGNWTRRLLGTGNQETMPNRGASEIKRGHLAEGRDYLATIEPWHGFQVVVYTPPGGDTENRDLWNRKVLDDRLKWGHAVLCADLDGDPDQELIIGVRDDLDNVHRSGLRIYDPHEGSAGAGDATDDVAWSQQLIDPGGVAIEDLAVGDLNGDSRPDIVAAGRATKNVRVYWNLGPAAAESP
jgi:hypothetical protein